MFCRPPPARCEPSGCCSPPMAIAMKRCRDGSAGASCRLSPAAGHPAADGRRARAQGWTIELWPMNSATCCITSGCCPMAASSSAGAAAPMPPIDGGVAYRAVLTRAFQRSSPPAPVWRSPITGAASSALPCDRVPSMSARWTESRTVWTALAYHGNGVAMGTWIGRAVVAGLIAEVDDGAAALPAHVLTRPLRAFSAASCRPFTSRAPMSGIGWRDERP